MAQIVITDTFDASREQIWSVISDLSVYAELSDDIDCTRLDNKQGIGARRRITIAGHAMVDEVLARSKDEQITFGAIEFHDAPFKHFVTTIRLAGEPSGPTSVALAVDFAGGLAGLTQKGRIQRTFEQVLEGIGRRAADTTETIQVTA